MLFPVSTALGHAFMPLSSLVVTENSIGSDNAEIPVVRAIMFATMMSF
jgi:hypothetical protein